MDNPYDALVAPGKRYSDVHILSDLHEKANAANIPYPRIYVSLGRWSTGWVVTPRDAVALSAWIADDYLPHRVSEFCEMLDTNTVSSNEFVLAEHGTSAYRLLTLPMHVLQDIHRVALRLVVENRYPTRTAVRRAAFAPSRRNPRHPTHAPYYAALGEHMRETIKLLREGERIRDLAASWMDGDIEGDNLLGAMYELSNVIARSLFTGTLDRINDALSEAGATVNITALACGHFGLRVLGTRTNRGVVCSSCLEGLYVEDFDGEYLHTEDAYYWESDGCYHNCEEPDEDDEPGGDADALMDYSEDVMNHLSVDPSFVTTHTGDFHMGVELETILTYGDTNVKVYSVRQELGEEYLVAKYDGSLGDSAVSGRGIEWVTQPTSLAKHIDRLGNWEATAKNLVAWDAKCCGMHVHIDSRAFTASSLGKMLQFYNLTDNADFIRRIAGRHPDRDTQARHYAGRDISGMDTASPIRALKGKDTNRYTMVNTTNLDNSEARRLRLNSGGYGNKPNTVEVRIFRASMRKERLLAQLEFTHALVVFCRHTGFRSLGATDFTKWLSDRTSSYPRLAKFLGVRPNKHGKHRDTATTHQRVDETLGDTSLEPVVASHAPAALSGSWITAIDLETAALAESMTGIPDVCAAVTPEDLRFLEAAVRNIQTERAREGTSIASRLRNVPEFL